MITPIIEYLLAQREVKEGILCYPARQQFIIRDIPPGTILTFSLGPPVGAHAGLKYSATISEQVVPGSIYMEVAQAGNMYVAGFNEADWQREYLSYFVIFTDANPIHMQVQNVSAVNQDFLATQWLLVIPTEEALKQILQHMAAASQVRTNELLQKIASGSRRSSGSGSLGEVT